MREEFGVVSLAKNRRGAAEMDDEGRLVGARVCRRPLATFGSCVCNRRVGFAILALQRFEGLAEIERTEMRFVFEFLQGGIAIRGGDGLFRHERGRAGG